MTEVSSLGKMLMIGGAVLFALGLMLFLGDKVPFLGRLQGDILIQRKNFGIYFPIATCVVVSLILTVILNLISRR